MAEGLFIPITSIPSTKIQNNTLMWTFLAPYNSQVILFVIRTTGQFILCQCNREAWKELL